MRARTLLLFVLAGCGSGGGVDGTDGGLPPGATLEIAPRTAVLLVEDGAEVQQTFTATLHRDDGAGVDVSDHVDFRVDNLRLGVFDGAVFEASGQAAGQGVISATYEGVTGQAFLTVRIRRTAVVEPAPDNAAELFRTATEDAAMAPEVVYPPEGALIPPNVGDFEVHWRDSAGSDLYEVALISDYVDLRTYVTGTPQAGSWVALAPEVWRVAGDSHRGGDITITVRGLSTAAPETAGTSAPITTPVAQQDVQGGIYYWAAKSTAGPGGIYRHDMGSVGEPAEPFYTTDQSPGGKCVACHVLSRDGTRMAITYEGGDGPAAMLDVGSRESLWPADTTLYWNFATFEPHGGRILTGSGGTLTLRSTGDGSEVATVPTTGWATHPDFHPQGTAIVYVVADSPKNDWTFTGGAIVTRPFDPGEATFGEPTVLVEGDGNNYYPSWSPDGEWILFNRSTEDAYDDASAELWVVKADGTEPPIRLDDPNVSVGLTNSWARWAPFEQILGEGQDRETFYWFTFSSKRDFGVRLVGESRPQIWMAPFFPERALAGEDPSAPAFRLPAQDLEGNNHIAQWTETVVPIE